jgi:hypothetical protein
MAVRVTGYSNLVTNNTQIRTNRTSNNILLGDVGIRFQSSRTVQLELKNNHIANCNRGIHSIIGKHLYYYVNLDVSSNEIYRNLDQLTGITPNHGISVAGSNANEWLNEPNNSTNFRINDNTFIGGRRGIDLQDMTIHLGQVNNNKIVLGTTQLFQDIADQVDFYGVFLRNVKGRGNVVQRNNIMGYSYQLGDSKAIRVENTPNFTISCNSTNNTRAGIYFFGNCPSSVLNNTMTVHRFGLWLDGAAIIGTQGTNDNQGNPLSPSGNKWVGTGSNAWTPYSGTATLFGSERIKTYVSSSNANFSKFYINNGSITNPIDSWAKDAALSTIPYDNSTRMIPVFNYPTSDPCANGLIQITNEDALSEEETEKFLSSLEETTQSSIQLQNDASEIIKEHAAFDVLHRDEDLRDSVAVLHNFYLEKSEQNIGILKEIEDKVLSHDYLSAEVMTNNLVLLNNIEQALKEVLELKLKFDQNSFTSDDSTSLHLWATSCYYYFGKAVPMAQTLFNTVFESSTVFIEDCSGIMLTNSAIAQENSLSMDVYPNPNNDILFVKSFDKNIKTGNIIIYDIEGTAFFDGEITFDEGIDLRKILNASGVYILEIIYTSGESVYTDRKRVVFLK